MRAITAAMFIVATGVSSIGLSGSTPPVTGHPAQHGAPPPPTRTH
jgi:hypothetical protein